MNVWYHTNMDEGKVFSADAKLELTHGFNKRHRFDIPDGTSQLKEGFSMIASHLGQNPPQLYKHQVFRQYRQREFEQHALPSLE